MRTTYSVSFCYSAFKSALISVSWWADLACIRTWNRVLKQIQIIKLHVFPCLLMTMIVGHTFLVDPWHWSSMNPVTCQRKPLMWSRHCRWGPGSENTSLLVASVSTLEYTAKSVTKIAYQFLVSDSNKYSQPGSYSFQNVLYNKKKYFNDLLLLKSHHKCTWPLNL